jgi:hypothetical protein
MDRMRPMTAVAIILMLAASAYITGGLPRGSHASAPTQACCGHGTLPSSTRDPVYVGNGSVPIDSAWKTLSSGDTNNVGKRVIESRTGEYYVLGMRSDPPNGVDLLLIKYSTDGEETWNRTYGSVDSDYARDLIELRDGSLILVGSSEGSPSSDRAILVWRVKGTDRCCGNGITNMDGTIRDIASYKTTWESF